MQGVVEGFVTIGAIIVLGTLLAHLRILDLTAQEVLSKLAFFVASPALMAVVLARTDVAAFFSPNLLASLTGVAAAGAVYIGLAFWLRRDDLRSGVIGTLSSVFVNAGNLGIPIATYVLGDVAYIAPMLLAQLLVLQPVALAVLDHSVAGSRMTVGKLLLLPIQNPLTVGSLSGLGLAVTGTDLPRVIDAPLELVAGMAVPAMLLAYGISLRRGPKLGRDSSISEVGVIACLKLGLQPAVAFVMAHYGLHLKGNDLLAVVVIAALPTAQNVFIHASRYRTATALARDAIFVTTLASAPVIFVIAALLT